MKTAENLTAVSPDDLEVFVGKDVLELLSSSMYVNPLAIFREYVQNAADAIDDAVAAGVLSSINDGSIEINLDHIDRRVLIRDNGLGLANRAFVTRMLSFGASGKRGTDARGFRGVGRLSALGYVQKLVFRSRSIGDTSVMEATWDGRVVKQLLADNRTDTDLRSIVKEAVTIRALDGADFPPHFFEVELSKPRRIANDKLLNESEIATFVSQVCPCPFSPGFGYGSEIEKLLAAHGRAGKAYRIHINGSAEPLYRPYRDRIEYSDTKHSSLKSLRTFTIDGADGEVGAVGWLLHHDYQGSIPSAQGVRGLRVRVGNIQVGHDRIFVDVFPEERFCSWTVGEVHVIDPRVVPNGRRDEFESNAHFENLVAHLRPLGAEVARECRVSSQKRNRVKAFELNADKVYERLEVLGQGAVSDLRSKALRAEIGSLLQDMGKAIGFDMFEEQEKGALRSRLHSIEEAVSVHSSGQAGAVLPNLHPDRREIYQEVFDLIYECSVNQVAAKSLIDRMLGRLSRQ
jgi:hypothetical protein